MMRRVTMILAAIGLSVAGAALARGSTAYHVVPGQFGVVPNRSPDGNSIFLEAPGGLILVDTGRHADHSERLIAYARARNRPIVAIVNTHWHLDHNTGNREVRAAYPQAAVHTSEAVRGALATFLHDNQVAAQRRLDAGQIPPEQRAGTERFLSTMADPAPLLPTRPVTRSGDVTIAGRRLRLNLAPFAATEGDTWIHDRAAGLVIVGDLVVAEVPFMDTACVDGWRRALDAIAAVRFRTLIPGHGDPMTRAQFLAWRTAFNNFADCGGSDRPKEECVAGWQRDAAQFIPESRRAMIGEYATYYVDTRLRAAPEERQRYCRPLRAP